MILFLAWIGLCNHVFAAPADAAVPQTKRWLDGVALQSDAVIIPSIQLRPEQLEIDILDFHVPKDLNLRASPDLLKTPKWFKEHKKDSHRASGYGENSKAVKGSPERHTALQETFQNLASFSKHHDFKFWLAHGSLVGQYWGQKIMPFDDDLDVQTSFAELHRMRKHSEKQWNKRYLFTVNPWYVVRASKNNPRLKHSNIRKSEMSTGAHQLVLDRQRMELNVIDARFVDTVTGVFIDITVLATESSDDSWNDLLVGRDHASKEESLHDKSVHTYTYTSISPLQRCTFEDTETWCPNDIKRVMKQEYPNSLSPRHKEWYFHPKNRQFERSSCRDIHQSYATPTLDNCDEECQSITKHRRSLTWLQSRQRDKCVLLVEYLIGEEKRYTTITGAITEAGIPEL